MGALTKSKEFEIRMRYELGEDLNKLAVIYKVPLTTINKRKKLAEIKGDAWIKGARSKSAYQKFMKNDEERRRELRETISSKAREELDILEKVVEETYKKPDAMLYEHEIETAVKARANRINTFLDLKRSIEDIPTLKEEAELEKMKVDIELKRLELAEKGIDLKLKRAEVQMLLGDEKQNDTKDMP